MSPRDRELRRSLRLQVAAFAPDADCAEIVDLIMQAATEAINKVTDTARLGSNDSIQISVLAPAFSVLKHLCDEQLSTIITTALQEGMPVTTRAMPIGATK